MDSKHDILTAAITIVFIVAFVVLDVTHSMTNTSEQILGGGITAVIAYWFVRGGASISSSNNNSQQNNTTNIKSDLTDIATQAATQAIQTLVQTPATGGVDNANKTSGNIQS